LIPRPAFASLGPDAQEYWLFTRAVRWPAGWIWRALGVGVLAASAVSTPTAHAATSSFTTFVPGAPASISETVPVSIVLVGFGVSGPQGIDVGRLKTGLPSSGAPLVRAGMLWYGLIEPLGIQWHYTYHVVSATADFQSALWRELESLAQPAALTTYQTTYNAQRTRALDITDNAEIDARTIERWLSANAGPMLGVDTSQDTIFYINWFGQPGFRFHVYNLPLHDPDTGFDFGARDKNKLRAFGGSPDVPSSGGAGRVWFYDLSAGPDWATISWHWTSRTRTAGHQAHFACQRSGSMATRDRCNHTWM
jgi:hypothetical protein